MDEKGWIRHRSTTNQSPNNATNNEIASAFHLKLSHVPRVKYDCHVNSPCFTHLMMVLRIVHLLSNGTKQTGAIACRMFAIKSMWIEESIEWIGRGPTAGCEWTAKTYRWHCDTRFAFVFVRLLFVCLLRLLLLSFCFSYKFVLCWNFHCFSSSFFRFRSLFYLVLRCSISE